MRGAIEKLHAFELHLQLALGDDEILDVGVRTEPLEDAAGRIAQRHRARLEPAIDAVEAADAEADVVGVAAGHDARPLGMHLDPIVRMHLLEPAAAQLLRFAAPGVVEPLPAQVVGVAIAQAGPDHLRQRFRQRLEARAILAQLLHGLAVLGDVDAGADEAHELAAGSEMRAAALEQPAPGAVVALQAVFHFIGPARVERRVIGVERAIEIGRVQVVAPAVADLLLDVAADEIEPALVEPGDSACPCRSSR